MADGIAIHGFSTVKYIRDVLIPAVHEGACRAGRDPKSLQIRGGGFVVTGRTKEELAGTEERARRQLSFYASTRSYSRVMSTHGWDDEASLLHRLSVEGKCDDMVGVITDEMMEEFCVMGTWDEMPARMREKYAGSTHRSASEWSLATPTTRTRSARSSRSSGRSRRSRTRDDQ